MYFIYYSEISVISVQSVRSPNLDSTGEKKSQIVFKFFNL